MPDLESPVYGRIYRISICPKPVFVQKLLLPLWISSGFPFSFFICCFFSVCLPFFVVVFTISFVFFYSSVSFFEGGSFLFRLFSSHFPRYILFFFFVLLQLPTSPSRTTLSLSNYHPIFQKGNDLSQSRCARNLQTTYRSVCSVSCWWCFKDFSNISSYTKTNNKKIERRGREKKYFFLLFI